MEIVKLREERAVNNARCCREVKETKKWLLDLTILKSNIQKNNSRTMMEADKKVIMIK